MRTGAFHIIIKCGGVHHSFVWHYFCSLPNQQTCSHAHVGIPSSWTNTHISRCGRIGKGNCNLSDVVSITIEPSVCTLTYPSTVRQGPVDSSDFASRGDDSCRRTGTWVEVPRQTREPAELERGERWIKWRNRLEYGSKIICKQPDKT